MANRLTAILTLILLTGCVSASTSAPAYAQHHYYHHPAPHHAKCIQNKWCADESGQYHDSYWWADNRPSEAKRHFPRWKDDRDSKHRGNEREPGNVHPE
jgi:hypothetical protein